MPLLTITNRDISVIRRGRLYSSCVRSSMLHGSETWPVRKENEVALQRAEMRMVRWMCNAKVKDRVPSKELIERLVLLSSVTCTVSVPVTQLESIKLSNNIQLAPSLPG